jgi:replicative DNA helicase
MSENLANPASERKHDDLPELLQQVPCAGVTYEEWTRVGMGLKAEGYPLEVWDAWSATDTARYNPGEIVSKWNGFNGEGVSGSTVAYICKQYGAQVNHGRGRAYGWDEEVDLRAAGAQPAPQQPTKTAEPEPDYSAGRARERAYIDRCEASMLEGCDGWKYLTSRGLTPETIKRERLGWDAAKRVVVMPYSTEPGEYYHIDRKVDVDTHTKGKYRKPSKAEVGEEPVFHPADLTASNVVFVVEGGMDVYAVHQLGYRATGVISAHAYGRILDTLKAAEYDGTVVVMLDDDETGNKAATQFCKDLKTAGIHYCRAKQTPGTNDASEALETCQDALSAHLSAEHARATGGVYDPATVVRTIATLADYEEPVPTGFGALDQALEGGLRRGVVVLGALSSLGKTTLMIQIADNIARAGHPAFFVTIEQSAKEIVSKSIVRLMKAQKAGEAGAVSASEVNSARRRASWSKKTKEVFARAVETYTAEIAPNLRIMEAADRPNVAEIQRRAQEMKDATGTAPVVFVDYLQLMAPRNDRDTDKMTADNNMRELRQMARELHTTCMVVSSINRNSYAEDMSMSAFKESGGIEYSADVALGLQVFDLKAKLDAQDEKKRAWVGQRLYENEKAKDVRHLEVKVLKNRNGAMPAHPVAVSLDAKAATFTSGEWSE